MTELFSFDIIITLLIIIGGIFFFVKEYFRIDTTAILIMVMFIVTGVLAPEEGFKGFNHPATITIGCMFVLSAGIFKTGLLDGISSLLIRLGQRNYLLALVAIVMISGTLSAFINDTAVVALLLPVVMEMAKRTNTAPSMLLMPLSFGALLGGVCTLIGTSTNILISGIAQESGLEGFGMFEFSAAAIWLTLGGLVYLVIAGILKIIPKRKSEVSDELSENQNDYITEIILSKEAEGLGKSIKESPICTKYNFKIIQIQRGKEIFRAYASTHLQEGDILKIVIAADQLRKLKDEKGIEIRSDNRYRSENISSDLDELFEVLIPANSSLAGQTLEQLNFIRRFDAIVMAIRSRDGIRMRSLERVALKEGDLLLLLARADELKKLQNSGDLIVISKFEEKKPSYQKAIPALLIMAAVVLSASFNIAPIVITAMVGALLMILGRIISPEDAYKAIDWKVIFLLAGVLSMSTALEKTGGAELLSDGIFVLLADFNPRIILSVVFLFTFVATNFMSNNASAALMAPIAINLAQSLQISERPFLVAVMFAASLSFMTPMSYQTNTMIMTPGNYRFKDYLRVGTPLNILIWIIASFVIPLYFPF